MNARPKATKPSAKTRTTSAKPASGAVTGLRIPPDIIERLDARAATLSDAPEQIGRVTRNALVVRLLREGLDALDARETAKAST